MPTRPWREIRRQLSPDREARIQSEIRAELARMKLPELRRARQMTQKTVAGVLGIAQGDVSKLERRTDAYVGTLRNYIEALGGRLRVMAEFPDTEPIEIEGFSMIEPVGRRTRSASKRVSHARRLRRPRKAAKKT